MIDNGTMLVPMRQQTVAWPIVCRTDSDETLDGVLIPLADEHRKVCSPQIAKPKSMSACKEAGK